MKIADENIAVAVIDDATRRVLHFLEKSIGVCGLAIVIAHNLEHEKPDDIHNNDYYCDTANDETSIFQIVIGHGSWG